MSPRLAVVFALVLVLAPHAARAEGGGSIEFGGGSSKPTVALPASDFLFEKIGARWIPSDDWLLSAFARATEDFAVPDPTSHLETSSDFNLLAGVDVAKTFADHWTIDVGVNGSPAASRDIATTATVTNAANSVDVPVLVHAQNESLGGSIEGSYDTFDADHPHALDVLFAVNFAATDFVTSQSLKAFDSASGAVYVSQGCASGSVACKLASQAGDQRASLFQGRGGATATFTLFDDTEIVGDLGYYVYDWSSPGDVGFFTPSANGTSFDFGTGLPLIPPRFTLRPEIAQNIGPVNVRSYYQYSDYAMDASHGHTVGGRVQVAMGKVKLFSNGSYRADSLGAVSATTWMLSIGVSARF